MSSLKSKSTHWFCKRLAKRIMNKITECLRPGEEINQNILSTPVKFDSRKGILLGRLGLNSELCLLLHLPLLGFKRFIKREREREIWVDKGGVLLRENETKVATAIGNYLNNSEGSRKADGELTNPCAHIICAQYASRCHHCDSTPSLWSHPYGHDLLRL